MADKQKKDNFLKRFFGKIAGGAKATKSEVKKITWPSRKQLVNNTVIVIICIVIVGLIIAALDMVFSLGFNFLTDRKAGSDAEIATEFATDVVESATDATFVVAE